MLQTRSLSNGVKTVFILLFAGVLLSMAVPVAAQPPMNQSLEEFRQITQYGQADLVTAVSRIVRIVLSFQGLILVVIIILAGFKWMLSGGDEEKIKQAKGMIFNAIIGMALIVLSWSIASFLIRNLTVIVQ